MDDLAHQAWASGDGLMRLAHEAARRSPNRVRRIGAALRVADGVTIAACNTFPEGVRDLEKRHQGNEPFVWMEHAERNAIFEAARRGLPTCDATLASTFYPCADCARAIVQAGIARLYTYGPLSRNAFWIEHFALPPVILREGGVDVRCVEARAREAG
jgi:dCMP deaminase